MRFTRWQLTRISSESRTRVIAASSFAALTCSDGSNATLISGLGDKAYSTDYGGVTHVRARFGNVEIDRGIGETLHLHRVLDAGFLLGTERQRCPEGAGLPRVLEIAVV